MVVFPLVHNLLCNIPNITKVKVYTMSSKYTHSEYGENINKMLIKHDRGSSFDQAIRKTPTSSDLGLKRFCLVFFYQYVSICQDLKRDY